MSQGSRSALFGLAAIAAFFPACSDDDGSGVEDPALSYYRDAKPIVDARCATCHQPGEIGPFPLTNFEEVSTFAAAMRASIENGTMPPWQPSSTCNDYLEDIDLTSDEKNLLLAWLDAGAPEGDPAEAPAPEAVSPDPFVADLSLQLPEPYTPTMEPDDYRCQLIPWPADTPQFVTGLRVTPDQRALVHHVIVFLASPSEVEQYLAFDAEEEGPGYTCYGGPRPTSGGGLLSSIDPTELLAALQALGLSLADLQSGMLSPEEIQQLLTAVGGESGASGGFRSLGSWVPGIPNAPLPDGTGIRVEPGSMLVAQFHYNTLSAAPVPDQSSIEISTADTVEREATTMPLIDIGWISDGLIGEPMSIPAGADNVQHSTTLAYDSPFLGDARRILGLPEGAPLVVHRANHHMHQLGVRQKTEIFHDDGTSTCVLENPDWDFNWQGSYTLSRSITLRPGDEIRMGCTWDNTPANQAIIDGQALEPTDVSWGEGTTDEMCLGAFYVTGE